MNKIELHKGATRCVFLLRSVVVKTPRLASWEMFLNGLLANLQERKFWREMKHPSLAEVLYSDPMGLCLVMERAQETFPDGIPLSPDSRRRMKLFFSRCKKEGLPVDRHFSNIGRFETKLKLIDYGD